MTENGCFLDYSKQKNTSTFLTIPKVNYGRNMKKFDFSSCVTYWLILVGHSGNSLVNMHCYS